MCGAWRNWITIWVVRQDIALPLRRRNGTPCQRQFSTCSLIAPKVAVSLSGRHARLVPVLAVLAADRVGEHLLGLHDADRAEHLHLFVADGVGLEAGGGLHRRERHQLQQVALEHVPQHAHRVVVRRAMAHREVLGRRDLHVLDVVAVPDRLEDGVGEPQHQHVLHRFLAQVVVDAVDLVLGEDFVDLLVQQPGGVEVGAEGLFDHHAARPAVLPRQPRRAELRDDRRVELRRDGEVIDPRGLLPALSSVRKSASGGKSAGLPMSPGW